MYIEKKTINFCGSNEYTKNNEKRKSFFFCFCTTCFTAVVTLQAKQSVFIDLFRHKGNCITIMMIIVITNMREQLA